MPCHWNPSRWLACAAGCLVFVGNVAAQDEERLVKKPKPAPESPAAEPGTAPGKASDSKRGGSKSPQEKDAPTGESLKDDLLDLLLGPKKEEKKKSAEPTGIDPLDSAIEGMRSAQKRMLEKDAGEKTREIQRQVLEDLEKLIQQAKQPPPSPPSGSPPPSGNNDDPDQSPQDSSQPKTNPQPMPENAPSTGESSKSRTENEEKSKESSDESREAKEREAQLARRRDFVKDVWGHLPPAVRQKLLNVADERALPRYDELVRRYFESIAEQGRNDSPPANRRR